MVTVKKAKPALYKGLNQIPSEGIRRILNTRRFCLDGNILDSRTRSRNGSGLMMGSGLG